MYSANAVKEKLRQYLSERTPLSIEGFCEKAQQLCVDWQKVEITSKTVRNELRRYWREHDMQVIHSLDDLFKMLDTYFRDSASWWDNFFADRTKQVPFFLDVPDENLVEYFTEGKLRPRKVLELGCGNGRNALYMAEQGIQVDAVDISAKAIAWGQEMAGYLAPSTIYVSESSVESLKTGRTSGNDVLQTQQWRCQRPRIFGLGDL